MIEAIGIVVPAHDEQLLLPPCLVGLKAAEQRLDGLPVAVCVVADACTDQTARTALLSGVRVIEISARNVGVARAAGMAEVIRLLQPADPASIWLASTDADSTVPGDWLTRQLIYAEAGWSAVAGTIAVSEWNGHASHVPAAFAARYAHGPRSHPHVHGANLGIRADAYLAVGGFRPLPTGEDHALLAALAAAGYPAARVTDIPVRTSARSPGRAPEGFGHLLSVLARSRTQVAGQSSPDLNAG